MTNDETSLRKKFAVCITAAWRKSVTAIIETGQLLVEAKAKLTHGTFTGMVENDLDFGPRTAQCLMKIAHTPWLVNPKTSSLLPPCWTTLYALTQLTAKEFKEARERGWIQADLTLYRAERLKSAVQPIDQRIEAALGHNQHTCEVVQFEKPDDVVALKTGVEVRREQVSVEVQATIILGYLRRALDRFEEGCNDDQEQIVNAIIKDALFQDTIDALDAVFALLKQQAAAARPKPSLAVNNDAASPLHG
jgi:hypothetical protein